MDNHKPNLFLFGACDLEDALQVNNIRQNFRLVHRSFLPSPSIQESFDVNYRPRMRSTSLKSLYTAPGNIAFRVLDQIKENNSYSNFVIAEEIIKYPLLEFFKKHATKNDFLVVSLTSELHTKFEEKKEVITLHPEFIQSIKSPSFEWLLQHLSRDRCHVSFDHPSNIDTHSEYVRQFAKDIYSIFKERVVFVETQFANMAYTDSHRPKEYNIDLNKWIPFFKRSRIISSPYDHRFAEKCAKIAANQFLKNYPCDIPSVSIDNRSCLMDPYHRYGIAPFHFHPVTSAALGEKIFAELKNLQKKVESSKNL